MELLVEKTNEKYYTYLPFFAIVTGTLLLSTVKISQTSLCFVLPVLAMAIMSGYKNVGAYFIGLSLSVSLHLETVDSLILSGMMFLLFQGMMFFKHVKVNYVCFMAALLVEGYLLYFEYNIYVSIILFFLTFVHSMLFQELVPLLMHNAREAYTNKRMIILIMLTLLCILPLNYFDRMYFMIILRFVALLGVYYLGMQTMIPCLLYISIILMIQNYGMKDDVLSMLLPFGIYFIYQPDTKIKCISVYFLTHIILPFFVNYQYNYHGIMIVMSALLFFLFPKLNKKPPIPVTQNDSSVKVMQRANAFASLFQQLTRVFEETASSIHTGEYVGYVYEDVCSKCSSCQYCFHDHGIKRLVRLIDKGITTSFVEDDLEYIKHHCLNPKQYLQAIDKYQDSYQKVKKYNQQNQNLRKDLYKEFSVLGNAFCNLSDNVQHILYDEAKLKEHLEGYQFEIVFLHRNILSNEEYSIEMGLKNITKKEISEELVPILENYLDEKLEIISLKDAMHYLGYTSIILTHHLNYGIQYGFQQHSFDPLYCGDHYKVFSSHLDYFLALSDGMGQGKKAGEESKLTLEVLSKLILNGISLKDTLESINSFLRIKNHNDMFTTLDLCNINLTNAKMKLIKYGASASYHIRDGKVVKIEAKSLPVGVVSMMQLNHYEMAMQENDVLIMTSDGVGEQFEQVLRDHLDDFDLHPQSISTFLMEDLLKYQRKDDISILVIKLIKQDA